MACVSIPTPDTILPIMVSTGPTAATTPAIVMISLAVSESIEANFCMISVIFWITGVMIGISCSPSTVVRSAIDAWNDFMLLAVPSFVLAKSP